MVYLEDQFKEKFLIILIVVFYILFTAGYLFLISRFSFRNTFQYIMLLSSTLFSLVYLYLIFSEKRPSKWLVLIPSFITAFLLLTSPVYYHPASLPNDDSRWIAIAVLMNSGVEYPSSGIFFDFFSDFDCFE